MDTATRFRIPPLHLKKTCSQIDFFLFKIAHCKAVEVMGTYGQTDNLTNRSINQSINQSLD